ncbi:hypothetical protein [Micromonospora sp. CPCC 206061]|uniref:hypothetical protein n=1 Tax=Micromonospora sp. CPCC 206061 TaxID=3122410 RepID=UPI002FF0DD52
MPRRRTPRRSDPRALIKEDHAWSLAACAGQSVRVLIEAADASTASLVEAGVDDVRVTV